MPNIYKKDEDIVCQIGKLIWLNEQSRFIAMMSNYERTMELVNAANNSAGASQKQFDKTLESLASKLERLSNAWNEFSMGIANSAVIKTVIDLLTTLLETVNGLTSVFGDVGGAIAKIGLGFAAFAGGNKLFKGKLMTGLVKGVFGKDAKVVGGKAGQEASEGFLKSFSDKIQKTKTISHNSGKNLISSFFADNYIKNNDETIRENLKKYVSKSDKASIMASKEDYLQNLEDPNTSLAKFEQELYKAGVTQEELIKINGKYSVSTKAVGGALTAAGMAASFLGKQLEDAGYEKAGNMITNLGTAATGFGAAISVLGPMATAAGGAIATAFGPIMIILGVVTAGAIILNEIIETTAEKEERLAKQSEEAKQRTSELTDEYNKLIDTIEGLEEAEKTLDTLIEGSDAWKDKVEEINQEMLELVKLYPQLKKYLSLGTDGLYTWTDEGAALEELAQLRLEARNDSLATEVGLAQENLNSILTKNNIISSSMASDTNAFGKDARERERTASLTPTEAVLSNETLLAFAEAYQKDKTVFSSQENFDEEFKDNTEIFIPEVLGNNITAFEDRLIPILEQILDVQQLEEQTQQNYLTALLNSNSDQFAKSENKDYVRDRIQNSEKWTKYSENYDTDEEIEARAKAEFEAQGYENVKVKVGANGEVTYSYKNGEKDVSGSMGAKDTVATNYAWEDYSKSGQVDADVQKYEEQRQREIERLTKQYVDAGVDEVLARTTAAEMVDEAVAEGKLKEDGSLLPEEINNGQLLEHLDISKLYELKEQLGESTELGKAVAQAIDSVRKSNIEANKSFDQESELNKQLIEAYELFNLNSEAAETYKEKVAEATGLEGDTLDAAVIAKLEFEWADDQIDEVYDEVMAAFKMDDTDPRKFQAFESLLPALKKILGNENLTVDFIIDNQKEVLNFLNGVDGSLEELQAKSVLTLYADGTPAREVFEELITDLDNKEIEIGVKLRASNIPKLKDIQELIEKGDLKIEDAISTLFTLGYSAKTFKAPKIEDNKLVGYYSQIDYITPWFDSSNEPKYTPPEDKGKEEDPWENPYDRQYNTLEKINELLRQRELLEKQYQKLQTKGEVNYENTKKYYDDLFASFTEEVKLQKQLHDDIVKDELNPFLANNKNLDQYATYSEETGLLQIEWDKIEALESAAKEQGETLEKEITELKRLKEAIKQSADKQVEIEVNRANTEKELQDAYLAFEERLAAALENIEREALEEQQKLFDALTSAEEQLVEALNRNVDEMRQARENEQKQQEISDKERRLAYLRQDTTGANQLEIRQLEKEIGEDKESYRDDLIDQSLEKLQKQNEAAAEQREKQISLMESQVEYAVENGLYNKQAAQMLESASKNGFAYDPKIWNTLRNGENWSSKTSAGLESIRKAVSEELATAIYALANNFGTKGSTSTSSNTGSSGGSSGRKFTAHGSNGTYTIGSEKGITFLVGAQPGDTLTSSDTGDKSTWTMGSDGTATITTQNGDRFTINRTDLGLKPFATGGLADFTGPAWLDGTRSKPELVLNAQDTENFLVLKDVLSGVLANAPGAKSSGGDNYFDIDVNVEEIGSDYDVDQMAERIKQNIYQDGMYRNVNTINLLR